MTQSTTGLVEELRKFAAWNSDKTTGPYGPGKIADEAANLLSTQETTIAELVAALEAIRDGDVPRPVGKHWFPDESPSKHDRCIHDIWMYDTCCNCIDAFVETALTKSRSAL